MNSLFIIIGLFLVIMGGLVWRFKLLALIGGYDEDYVKDKKGLAKWLGINYILMGLLVIINSVIGLIYDDIPEIITIAIFTGIIYFFISLITFGGRKYKRQ